MPYLLHDLLTSNRELRQFADKAKRLAALQRLLEQAVPPAMARYCRVAAFERHTLTVACDNGAVAAKLRQLSTEIAAQFQARGHEITVIQVRVQVNLPRKTALHRARPLSPSGKKQLTQFAASLPDSPLRAALERLGKKG